MIIKRLCHEIIFIKPTHSKHQISHDIFSLEGHFKNILLQEEQMTRITFNLELGTQTFQ